MLAGKRTY